MSDIPALPQEPPAPQLEVTWINELRGLLTEIRDQVGALSKKPESDPPKPADPIPAPSGILEAKIDKMLALLEMKSSTETRTSFLTRRKR